MPEQLVIPKHESWKMFDAISAKYDVLNRILSLGQDVRWRNLLKRHLPATSEQMLLDIATGTADVIITLVEDNPKVKMAFGVDMAREMLKIGQSKVDKKALTSKIVLQHGDAQALGFMDNTFDCVTIAFGIRNIPDLRQALLEMCRVSKKGGRVLILEFSLPANPILRAGHWMYLQWFVPAVGFLCSGNWKAYKYLNQTIESFPYGERFCKILKQFGFTNVHAYPLMGGVATIYAGDKS